MTDAVAARQDELTRKIAYAIGVYETNQGGDAPKVSESKLDTVAGIPASMATLNQLTMPRAITELKDPKQKELLQMATPALTIKELNAAEKVMIGVEELLGKAVKSKASAAEFAKANAEGIEATGLSAELYVGAAKLDRAVAAARKDKLAGKYKTYGAAAKSIDEKLRMGMSVRDLARYVEKKGVKKKDIWGENRAALQRLAVQRTHPDLARRIEEIVEANGGTGILMATLVNEVAELLAREPPPTDEEIVKAVAQANNPNEGGYGERVWETYERIEAIGDEDPLSRAARTDDEHIRAAVAILESEDRYPDPGVAPRFHVVDRRLKRVFVTAVVNGGERVAVFFEDGWPVVTVTPGAPVFDRYAANVRGAAWSAA